MSELSFIEFLKSKKIDPGKFAKGQAVLFKGWKIEFDQMNPKSFAARKLYSLNKWRRMYLFEPSDEVSKPKAKPKVKPKIPTRPKIK